MAEQIIINIVNEIRSFLPQGFFNKVSDISYEGMREYQRKYEEYVRDQIERFYPNAVIEFIYVQILIDGKFIDLKMGGTVIERQTVWSIVNRITDQAIIAINETE